MQKNVPNIYAFNETSEAGDKVFAPSVFIQGCNLQCPFCFNSILAKSQMKKEDIVPLEVVDAFIDKEKPDMVMISGGEPLMIKNLVNLVDHFIDKGCKIGLSTHGIYTARLVKLLPKLDYVALDIKSDRPEVYEFLDLISDNDSYKKVLCSKSILQGERERRKGFTFESRTTLYPAYVNKKTIHAIGKTMLPDERWVLQQYRPTKRLYDMTATKGIEPYEYEELQELLSIAEGYTSKASIRYV